MGFGYSSQVRVLAEEAKKKKEAEKKKTTTVPTIKPTVPTSTSRQSGTSTPNIRQQGSPATATATKTGVAVFPKITAPTSNYGGGIAQEVKPYLPSSNMYTGRTGTGYSAVPSTTPTVSQSYSTTLPSWLDTQRGLAQRYAGVPSGGGTGGGSGGGGGGSSRGSGSRSQTPTIKAPTQFTPTYSAQPTGVPSGGAQPATETTYQGPQFIYDWSNSYRTELANLRDEELALAARLNDQFMKQLDQQIAQYTQYYEQMGQGVDPATEAALARLKQEMEQDQKSILEYLNTRGIAQSGITTAEFGKLAGQYSDQKSQMLAGRLTDLQNQFLTNMRGFMDQKIQGMGQFTQNAMGVQQRYTQGMQSAMENAMDMTFGEWQRQQQERAAMEQSMIPYTQGPTPYQQSQLNYQRQSQSQQAAYQNQQAQRAAQQQQAQAATNEAISRLASYPSREAAEASIRNTAQGLAQMGVDIQALYKALDMYWPRSNLNQYFNQY